jgi:hypothetical protein
MNLAGVLLHSERGCWVIPSRDNRSLLYSNQDPISYPTVLVEILLTGPQHVKDTHARPFNEPPVGSKHQLLADNRHQPVPVVLPPARVHNRLSPP